MEPKQILRKRLMGVLKAAVYGAVLFDGLILADNLAYDAWGHGNGWLAQFISGFGFLLTVPSGLLSVAVRHKGGFLNVFVINGALGAVLFGLVATFWQFAVKNYEK